MKTTKKLIVTIALIITLSSLHTTHAMQPPKKPSDLEKLQKSDAKKLKKITKRINEMVSSLLAANAQVEGDSKPKKPLTKKLQDAADGELKHAIKIRNVKEVKNTVAAGASMFSNWRYPTLRPTPLTYALIMGKAEVVQALIEDGADCNEHNNAPLNYAAKEGYSDIARILIEHHADVNAVSQDCGLTQDGFPPLLRATLNPLQQPVWNKERNTHNTGTEIVHMLLAAQANVNAANPFGETALLLAVKHDLTEMSKILFFAGANPRLMSNIRESALNQAQPTTKSIFLGAEKEVLSLVADQNWLPEELARTNPLEELLPIPGLAPIVYAYASPFRTDDEFPLLHTRIKNQIMQNKNGKVDDEAEEKAALEQGILSQETLDWLNEDSEPE